MAVIGPDGRPGLTPMWFDHENDRILVNTASRRPKCGWIRNNPRITVLVVNPDNPYHWVSIRALEHVDLAAQIAQHERRGQPSDRSAGDPDAGLRVHPGALRPVIRATSSSYRRLAGRGSSPTRR